MFDIVDFEFIRITILYKKNNFNFNFTKHIHVLANSKFKFFEKEINLYKMKFKVYQK